MYVINLDMSHEAGGAADGSPQQTPSPPHAPRLPGADNSFHHQIMQNQSPRKNHIAERAKHSLENNFLLQPASFGSHSETLIMENETALATPRLASTFARGAAARAPREPKLVCYTEKIQLKKQQQLQQEILLQHFQQQRQQLAEQHEQQLRHHFKLWEQQKALEEAAAVREAREAREAAERERERERLELLRNKDKHDHSANASTQVKQKLQEFLKKKQAAANANGTVPGSPYRNWGIVKSSSGESITSGGGAAHPYRLPLALNAPPPQPSPADFPLRKTASEPNMLKLRLKARVIERRASPLARRPLKSRAKHRNCSDGASPRGSPTSCAAPIREEDEAPRAPDLLFSSPSLPNISLAHKQPPPPPQVSVSLPPVSEAEAYGPAGVTGATGPACAGAAGTCGRLPKRPLGRTHSAPLPLGDPALAAPPHHYLRDQIRKTVLTRAHDAAAAQLREESEGEVIDLTRKPGGVTAPPPHPPPQAAAPLARALSSPLVGARPRPTGLAYDAIMLKHGCACGAHAPTHPEHGGRLQSVWARLCETGLAARTERTRPRKATLEELQSVHTEAHVLLFGGRSRDARVPAAARQLVRLACGGLGVDADTAWCDLHTAAAARAAAGAVLDLALRVARNELRNGFAVVRPPGHHAEPNQAMGFCFFNSVGVAARTLRTRMHLQRVLIVDWDVHHGNGTQQIFYADPHALYISIHRHDDGNFFPGTGAPAECGAGAGLGFNVNIAWSGGLAPPLGDAEYLAAFRSVVMPIAKEFDPELVLVSCGFDAARGHPAPLGGYEVSPACFAHLTAELMTLAGGRLVLSLEGGYDLPAMCDCAQECVRALLGDRPPPLPLPELARRPAPAALDTLHKTIAIQSQHWPNLKRYSGLVNMSALEAGPALAAARLGSLQTERDAADTAAAMATLSMLPHHAPRPLPSPDSSRSVSEEPMEQDEGK